MVDLHSHILPCIDDGAKSFDESIHLVRTELENGVTSVAVTPHFACSQCLAEEFLKKRNKLLEALRNALSISNIPVKLIAGAEVLLTPEILKEDRLRELCYANTNFMLVELPTDYYREWLPDVLYQLRLRNVNPVIAHVERYGYYVNHTGLLYDIVSSGGVIQLNADSVIKANWRQLRYLSKLIDHNLIHIIATDTHSVAYRPPRLREAMLVIEKRFGREFADYLNSNSKKMACGQEPDFYEPIAVRKGFLKSFC